MRIKQLNIHMQKTQSKIIPNNKQIFHTLCTFHKKLTKNMDHSNMSKILKTVKKLLKIMQEKTSISLTFQIQQRHNSLKENIYRDKLDFNKIKRNDQKYCQKKYLINDILYHDLSTYYPLQNWAKILLGPLVQDALLHCLHSHTLASERLFNLNCCNRDKFYCNDAGITGKQPLIQ